MEWVVQAAKKKTRRVPGSSRSIVESLNIFNDVVNEGHSEISSILNDADVWLKNETSISKIENNKGFKQADETSSIISPEKTQYTFEMDYKNDSSILQKDTAEPADHHETPARMRHEMPSTTPKSLAEDTTIEAGIKVQPVKLDSDNKYAEKEEEASIWSPFRREKSSNKDTVASTQNVEVNDTNRQSSPRSMSLKTVKEIKNTESIDPPIKSLDQAVKDRSQRRSNMFVPLPRKDPLIVQHGIPETTSSNRTSIPVNPETVPTDTNKKVETKRFETSTAEKKRSPTQEIPSLSMKGKTLVKNTQTPGHNTDNSTSVNVSRATTSVFDRLSSLPTKSFENKKAIRSTDRKMSSSSSIDVTGSPMRRTSFSIRSNTVIDASVQETLKTIFSSNNHRNVDQNSYQVAKLRPERVSKKVNSPGMKDRHRKREYVSPKRLLDETNETGAEKSNKIPNGRTRNEKSSVKAALPTSRIAGPNLKSPTQNGNMQSTNTNLTNSRERRLVSQGSLSHSSWTSKIDQPLFETKAAERLSQSNHRENKPKNHDRLTKFQLLPPIESEKDDLKRKLSKRLSEVMRSQQDQQRRKQEQQKRKSHLEEDFIRRTRLWNEVKETRPVESSIGASIDEDGTEQRLENNNILHDLNIVDHRNIIGRASHHGGDRSDNESELANHTLPEINSDSDEEIDYALPQWAKSPYLREQLYLQENWDPKKIFGPLPPVHIDQIFQSSRFIKLKSRQAAVKKT